jgi:pyruvate,orthophosphate dikinase
LTGEIAGLRVRKQHQHDFSRDDDLRAKEELLHTAQRLFTLNPIMGLRGASMSLVAPELFALQIRSILLGAKAARRRGADPHVRILVPAVIDPKEFEICDAAFRDALLDTGEAAELGVMIECPRSCFLADQFAVATRILCIETDSLQAATFGYDAGNVDSMFLTKYVELRIYTEAPFATLDQDGVGQLMKICADGAKAANQEVVISACGQNCYDERSINFCHALGVNSVTCKPTMVPIARLCAAQAIMRAKA